MSFAIPWLTSMPILQAKLPTISPFGIDGNTISISPPLTSREKGWLNPPDNFVIYLFSYEWRAMWYQLMHYFLERIDLSLINNCSILHWSSYAFTFLDSNNPVVLTPPSNNSPIYFVIYFFSHEWRAMWSAPPNLVLFLKRVRKFDYWFMI